MAATFILAALLAGLGAGPLTAADPVPPIDVAQPPAPIKAAESNRRLEQIQPQGPTSRRLDPTTCAELCRFFERLWSLEKRAPEAPAPTS